MSIKFANNATSTLASGITSSATSLTVASGNGALFPTLSGSDYFYCTLANTSGTVEIVKVTARSTDTFTVTRGQDGTSGVAWNSGDKVELRVTAADLAAMAQTANNLSDLASVATARTNLGVSAAGTLTTNWTVSESAGKLTFSYSGVAKFSIDSSGNIIALGNVSAYTSP